MNYNNIKLLFFTKTNENINYIFSISKDNYQYTMASYNYTHSTHIIFTLNKITHDLEYEKEYFLSREKLVDIINESKNIKDYKCFDTFDFRNHIINHSVKHIRKLKIENICQ